MAKVVKRSFSLTEEQAKYIDEKIASGGYASGSEVVREGLRGLQEGDEAIETWLREEVVPTLEELDKNPSRAIPIDEAFAQLLSEIEEDDREREERERRRARKAPLRRSA